ncbi:zeta toxin [Kribbella steppae]|uniref:UDP-N-acetylglucosamine kinase n=1 Tax=Kribbella steppae TaxID=2512223 RepID=A0A4R2H1Q0_9ACTN|nr:zeta toxin family protein [Kribbella steppae]TCO18484.1 zeta toxin [Kribbella steppae]
MTADPTLTPAESDQVIARRLAQITPRERPSRAPGERPYAVLIGGQPAAGKTTLQELIQAALDADRTAVYDFDDDSLAHPRYDAIMRANGINGNDVVAGSLPPELRGRCLDHLRAGEYDVIASAPLQSEDAARAWLQGFRDAGYRVAVVYVATHEADSTLGVANRYQQAKDDTGIGRWVKPQHHNHAYRGIPDTAHDLESQGLVDDIYVVDRDGNVLYENHRTADGSMAGPLQARETLVAGRNRPPTVAEHQRFVETALPLHRRDDLEPAVDEAVRASMRLQVERPAAQPDTREPAPGSRLDQRLMDLQRISGSGVASPHTITSPSSTSSVRGTGGGHSGRSPSGESLDR